MNIDLLLLNIGGFDIFIAPYVVYGVHEKVTPTRSNKFYDEEDLQIINEQLVSARSILTFYSAFFTFHWGPHQRVYRYSF